MPKIFGAGFHEIDWQRSVLRLRLDDMHQGEWIELGFIPWPKHYRPRTRDVQVTSVHVNYSGSRARVGLRFEIPPRTSRFACAQDELDELRSRRFPRQAQDQQFLEAARQRLLASFSADPAQELRILAVDLGETGAGASVYQGRTWQKDLPLPIVKIDRSYAGLPEILEADKRRTPPRKFEKKNDSRGVRKEHVGRHLLQLQSGAAQLAQHRQQAEPGQTALRESDYRGLTRHIRWMIRDWARHNAARIVAAAEESQCDLIVFESLRGFRPRSYDVMDEQNAAQKRLLAFFAYGQIRRKVAEKAVERGMRVVTAPYGYSSQVCAACGHRQQEKARFRKNKDKRRFECECGQRRGSAAAPPCACKFTGNSDANAARVLARVFWGEIVLPAHDET